MPANLTQIAAAALAAVFALSAPASAAGRHHRHRVPVPVAAPETAAATPFSFYPNEIQGGVSGNLPFNNQLRKLSDPLNANGGGG